MKNIYDLLNNLDAGKAEEESFERVDMSEDEQDEVMKYILSEEFNSRTTKKKNPADAWDGRRRWLQQ